MASTTRERRNKATGPKSVQGKDKFRGHTGSKRGGAKELSVPVALPGSATSAKTQIDPSTDHVVQSQRIQELIITIQLLRKEKVKRRISRQKGSTGEEKSPAIDQSTWGQAAVSLPSLDGNSKSAFEDKPDFDELSLAGLDLSKDSIDNDAECKPTSLVRDGPYTKVGFPITDAEKLRSYLKALPKVKI
ncbi:uncharacterized protein LOC126802679 isoform X2 [Argentina anserina]|uniref:uncharacterized protein LOC126802679 isoform X2 n=1 Tax=Argentina anserina TaxID=57926 RepID=UPI00217692F9|nr:uncharacterized protein LOC126802679 isoform X2 [Potentilla anserina]